jgi:hypothetical protein
MRSYVINDDHQVMFGDRVVLRKEQIISAINYSNEAIKRLSDATSDFDINVFDSLGMRNLSSFVGEFFVKSIEKASDETLAKNPHQDGYPDLLFVDSIDKKEYLRTLLFEKDGKFYPVSKSAFSPFSFGGIEVKATCGNTPSASIVPKPLIGEPRISLMTSFEWKAHHRETNYLLAILWDFIDEIPVITACFYRNDLTPDDWGNIIHPIENGGRTTSVSIMKQSGVKKMCSGWIAVLDDNEYIDKLANRKWIGYRVDECESIPAI